MIMNKLMIMEFDFQSNRSPNSANLHVVITPFKIAENRQILPHTNLVSKTITFFGAAFPDV